MGIVRPKILSVVTVPSGGWDLDFTVSVAGSLDTPLTATIPAGNYFISWDAQSDDLLHAVTTQIRAAIVAGPGGTNRFPYVGLNTAQKVVFFFGGSNFTGAPKQDVALNWTTSAAGLASALGVNASADDTSTGVNNPSFTMDYQHAYAWYSTEDGQLESIQREDINENLAEQAVTYGGQVKTVRYADRYTNTLKLNWVAHTSMWSGGVQYGSASYPYTYNVPLECWWYEARQGKRFRVYRNDTLTYGAAGSRFLEKGTNEVASTTQLQDSGKTWPQNPQQYTGQHVLFYHQVNSGGIMARARISSHTGTVLTLPTSAGGTTWDETSGEGFTITEGKYGTYVLDHEKMSMFEPNEIPNIDRYGIEIPMRKYVA